MENTVSLKLQQFFSQYTSKIYEGGKIILGPNQEITHIYYIQSGYIKQYIPSSEGGKVTLQLFKNPAFIPLAMFLKEHHNKYTFEAVETTRVHVAPVDDVMLFLTKDQEVLFDLTTRLSVGLAGLLQKIERITNDRASARVLSLLLHLATYFGEKKGKEYVITLPLSKQDIATWLGMHQETVMRKMDLLQEQGIIVYDGTYIILTDMDRAKRILKKNNVSRRAQKN